jgi:hypothetical protein
MGRFPIILPQPLALSTKSSKKKTGPADYRVGHGSG